MKKLTFVMIEDDATTAEFQKSLVEKEGHTVHVNLDARDGVEFVKKINPDILVIDIMMPGVDGLEICRRVRLIPELKNLKIVVVSSKGYPADRIRAMSMGADGMILKPVDPKTFLPTILGFAADAMTLTYWGVRGTLPAPGRKTLRYGGNTSCFTIEMPRDQYFILDAGSGIRELSRHIMSKRGGKLAAKILISHAHSDHINALPFFVPLYISGNEFEIMGPPQGANTMREMVAAQMDGTYSPMTMRDLGARVFFRNLAEEDMVIGNIRIRTMLTTHPGNCLGYRITQDNRSFCYITDNELHTRDNGGYNPSYIEKLVDFVKGCDVLLTDATYTDQEYRSRVNWGHSCVSSVVEVAHAAGVKHLQLMHHDPDQTDDDIDRKLEAAQAALANLGSSTTCSAPAEGTRLRLSSSGELSDIDPVAY